ncbi:BSD domain containing protein [Cladophialophora carrionii]|uniref:BSD domain containing protein n=1 Tax=Cladophialophora carrionii TaxID=86049 RepID=A0A1C1CCR5_9EURO|nr:BSD domain containing protein [Cladophialophora carrionii]
MDLAYDHIVEQAYNPADRASTPTPGDKAPTDPTDAATPKPPSSPRQSLQSEFQETFKAFSNSQWGAKLGGFWGNVRKQGESLYEEAKKEAVDIGNDMEALRLKGAKGLGFGAEQEQAQSTTEKAEGSPATGDTGAENKDLQETDTLLARFKAEAAKRLKEVQKAEDAADEALLRFGTNIRNFLRDAVSVTAPDEEEARNGQPGEVLFESKDGSSGKRVIHTSRFDAQLHVIHTTATSFTQDPSGAGNQWDDFKAGFDIDKMTTRIAEDLDKYAELRSSMEKLVPEKVEYKDFWTRYYFLRHVVETQEEKRKELLRASANDTEEVGWDEDSDDEQEKPSTSSQRKEAVPKVLVAQNTNDSSTTIHQTPPPPADSSALRPSRRSHDEKSVADSDASYDLVSGATSRAPGSPKDEGGKSSTKTDESDEEDWE